MIDIREKRAALEENLRAAVTPEGQLLVRLEQRALCPGGLPHYFPTATPTAVVRDDTDLLADRRSVH